MTPSLRLRVQAGTATPADAKILLAECDRLAAENARIGRRINRLMVTAKVEDIEDSRR